MADDVYTPGSSTVTDMRTRQDYKGGPPSGGDGMDVRISKLEGQFDKLNDKVDQLRIDTAVLKEKVSNLPSKGFIVTATIMALALFSALMLFKEKIAAFIG